MMHADLHAVGEEQSAGSYEAARRGHDPETERRPPRREGLRLARHHARRPELRIIWLARSSLHRRRGLEGLDGLPLP